MPRIYKRNCDYCNKYYKSQAKKFCSYKCKGLFQSTQERPEWVRKVISKSKMGNKNPQWKGDKVGYTALHNWIKRRLEKPELCADCNVKKAIDLANISQEYKRNINDWEWLCRKCHMTKDGRIKNLKQYQSIKNG
jgi:hypothetical protein